MISDELIEVKLDNGVLSFDGRVVEAFGFQENEVLRVHIHLIERFEFTEGRLTGGVLRMRASGPIVWGLDLRKLDRSRRPEVEELIARVRGAAPNLKEG